MIPMKDSYSVLFPDSPVIEIVQFDFGYGQDHYIVNHFNAIKMVKDYTMQNTINAVFTNIKYKNHETSIN